MGYQKGVVRLYEDNPVSIKTLLALSWTAVTLCYLYGDYFELYVPGKVEGLVTGQRLLDTPGKLLLAALLLALPAMMVLLCVLLKPAVSRYANIIVGILLSVVTIWVATDSTTPWRRFYLVLAIIESCITLFIVWTAWRWPRVAAPSSTKLSSDTYE